MEVGKVFDTEKQVISYDHLGIARLIYQLPTTLCEAFLREVFKQDSIDSLDSETLFTIQRFFENNLKDVYKRQAFRWCRCSCWHTMSAAPKAWMWINPATLPRADVYKRQGQRGGKGIAPGAVGFVQQPQADAGAQAFADQQLHPAVQRKICLLYTSRCV